MVNEINNGPPAKKIKIKLIAEPDQEDSLVGNDFILDELQSGPQLFSFNYNDVTKHFQLEEKSLKNVH